MAAPVWSRLRDSRWWPFFVAVGCWIVGFALLALVCVAAPLLEAAQRRLGTSRRVSAAARWARTTRDVRLRRAQHGGGHRAMQAWVSTGPMPVVTAPPKRSSIWKVARPVIRR